MFQNPKQWQNANGIWKEQTQNLLQLSNAGSYVAQIN